MATRLSSRLLIHLPAPAAAVITTSPRLRKPTAAFTASYRRRRTRLAVLAGAAPSGGAVAPAAPAGENRDAGLTPAEVQRLEEFLKSDLPHLFDDVGIDRSAYDDRVRFRDPITRYDDIDGYLANIRLLKVIFRPDFYLHDVKQTGPYEITTRWTMVMKFSLLPWKPELVFTGLSIMGVNPQNLKFCSHVDIWDSIQNNEYFSFEGLVEVFKQLRYYKTPDIETPSYIVLKKTATYEVRKYPPFSVVEAKGEKLTGSSGFNNVTGYIFGKNASSEKIAMTTPVFTQASDDKLSDVSIQIALPMNKDLNSLPAPNTEAVTLRKVEGGIAAVTKFSGRPEEEIVAKKEKELRSQLLKDGLKPQQGSLLARYNDPSTKDFVKVCFLLLCTTFLVKLRPTPTLDDTAQRATPSAKRARFRSVSTHSRRIVEPDLRSNGHQTDRHASSLRPHRARVSAVQLPPTDRCQFTRVVGPASQPPSRPPATSFFMGKPWTPLAVPIHSPTTASPTGDTETKP